VQKITLSLVQLSDGNTTREFRIEGARR
jgi:hypothetical protein